MKIETGPIDIDDGTDVSVTIETRSEESDAEAETVHMHAHDAAVRAMQAIAERQHPDECDGTNIRTDWERRFEIIDGQREGES